MLLPTPPQPRHGERAGGSGDSGGHIISEVSVFAQRDGLDFLGVDRYSADCFGETSVQSRVRHVPLVDAC